MTIVQLGQIVPLMLLVSQWLIRWGNLCFSPGKCPHREGFREPQARGQMRLALSRI